MADNNQKTKTTKKKKMEKELESGRVIEIPHYTMVRSAKQKGAPRRDETRRNETKPARSRRRTNKEGQRSSKRSESIPTSALVVASSSSSVVSAAMKRSCWHGHMAPSITLASYTRPCRCRSFSWFVHSLSLLCSALFFHSSDGYWIFNMQEEGRG